MANYDPKVIQLFADKLYKKANSIIALYTFVGLMIGGVGGFSLGHYSGDMTIIQWAAIIAALIAGLLGFAIGREKAFLLKLQAQTALCQMKIEQNTSGKIV